MWLVFDRFNKLKKNFLNNMKALIHKKLITYYKEERSRSSVSWQILLWSGYFDTIDKTEKV